MKVYFDVYPDGTKKYLGENTFFSEEALAQSRSLIEGVDIVPQAHVVEVEAEEWQMNELNFWEKSFFNGKLVLETGPKRTEYLMEQRRLAYLPVVDQLDMQYKDAINGTTLWADHIAFVKANFPKE